MSSIGDAADKVFSDSSRTLAPKAVASQVALMSGISVATILLFNLLRPTNKVIYEPKVKYHEGNKPPPRISSHLFGWLPPLVHTKEAELLDKIGLDAVTFLRFNRMLRQLFTGIVVLTFGGLVPINIVYNQTKVKPDQRDILSMLTMRDVQGDFLYAHVVGTYLITILIIVNVWIHWKAMLKLRHAWFRSPEYLQSFYARTLVVTDVPKKLQSDEGLKDIFDRLGMPYPTTSVHIGRRVGRLPELIEYHNQTVREFEEILVRYLKDGKVRAKRPTIRLDSTMGFGGKKVDAIDFYTAKLKRTEFKIEEERNHIDMRKPENYGFASLAAVPYAHIVAHKLRHKHAKGTTVALAPNPKDIIWTNMNRTNGEIARRKLIGTLWLILVCFFNTVPLFIISVLANLDGIRAFVPFLDNWAQASPGTFSFISGVLPATISGIFGFFLPIIMRWLTQFMGALTYSRMDRTVVAQYFAFLIISQLIVFTLIGVIFSSAKEIINSIGKKSFADIISNLDALPSVIHRTYINQASYWLTYFPLRGFLVVFDLAQIINLVWLSFKTRVFGRTPRDIREWTQPPEFQYAVYYSNLLFMASVGLVFAPLAPLVALAACAVFWMSSLVYKYQLMFVFVSKVESGGRIWNVVVNRLLFCVLLMQSLMILTIGLQKGFTTYIWVSAVPPILFVVAFKIYINRTFLPVFNYFTPTQEEIRRAHVHSERADHKGNKLSKRFGHPALHAELFTPMLQAELMPLLSQVYSGRIEQDKAVLNEYGGQNMAAHIVPGGIKIAAINQADLEYDPIMYQRDRGEADWDQRSISSINMLDTASTLNGHYPSPSVSKLNEYYSHGPQKAPFASDIELNALDSQTEHLLSPRSLAFQQQTGHEPLSRPASIHANGAEPSRDLYRPAERTYTSSPFSESQHTLVSNRSPSPNPAHQYPPQQHNRQPSGNMLAGHQNPPRSPSPYMQSPLQQYPPQQHARQMSTNMLQQGRASPGPQQSYQNRSGSPGPYQAMGSRVSMGPNQMYSGHISPASNEAYTGRVSPGGGQQMYNGRSPSPGPNQAYGHSPHPSEQWSQQSHGRQPSGYMLGAPPLQARAPSPMAGPQHGRQQSANMLHHQHAPSLSVNAYGQVPPQQQHLRSPSGNPLANSPLSPAQGSPQAPYPNNHAGRGAYRP